VRRLVLWFLFALANLVVAESVVAHYFFQQKSEYPLALVHYAVHHYRRLASKRPIPIYQDDARLGYAHIPGARGRHRTATFDVTYSIGPEGERVIPRPAASRGNILFLGCSFTFGWGVEDNEAYPYLLGTKYWQDFRVVNKATNGYGTVHAYEQLQDALARSPAPSLVIYSMIPAHVCRNYLRPSWMATLAESGRGHPHFELVDGRPDFRGVTRAATHLDEHALHAHEVDLTAALLEQMQREAVTARVPFVVVLLPQRTSSACGTVDWPPKVIDALVRSDIPYVDLTERLAGISWLPEDQHPDPKGHSAIAGEIAKSRVAEILRDLRVSAQP
jgi:hypothetical protein